MFYTSQSLNDFIRDEKELLKKYTKELDSLPDGRLHVINNSGYMLYQRITRIDGKYHREGITKDKAMIKALARREFLTKMTNIMQRNIEAMKRAEDKVRDTDPTAIIQSMTKAYKTLPADYFFDEMQFTIDHRLDDEAKVRMQRHIEWAKQPYEHGKSYLQYKDKVTSFGLKVRSKSEQLIAEKLYDMGVPFRYEQVLHIYDEEIAPDFTFEDASSQLFYWEYAGKMNDK